MQGLKHTEIDDPIGYIWPERRTLRLVLPQQSTCGRRQSVQATVARDDVQGGNIGDATRHRRRADQESFVFPQQLARGRVQGVQAIIIRAYVDNTIQRHRPERLPPSLVFPQVFACGRRQRVQATVFRDSGIPRTYVDDLQLGGAVEDDHFQRNP